MRIHNRLFFLYIVIFTSCNKKTDIDKFEYYESGVLKKCYSTNADNKKEGIYLEFFEDGKLKKFINFRDNIKNGVYLEMNNLGKPRFLQTLLNDTLNGRFIEFYDDGKLKEYSNALKGLRHGVYLYFFNNSLNSVKSKGIMYKNELIHENLEYFENQKISKYLYKDSSGKDFFVKYYNESGSLLKFSGQRLVEVWAPNAKSLLVNDTLKIKVFVANPPDEFNSILVQQVFKGLKSTIYNSVIDYYYSDVSVYMNVRGESQFIITILGNNGMNEIDSFKFKAIVN